MLVRVSKGADYRYILRQGFAALPWYQCESVRPLAVESGKADKLCLRRRLLWFYCYSLSIYFITIKINIVHVHKMSTIASLNPFG